MLSTVSCPQEKLNVDDNCFLIQGIMTFMSHASDDLTMSIDYMRQEIKDSMDSNALLHTFQGRSAEGLASINRVAYLGDSLNDVFRTSPTVSDGVKSVTASQNADQGRDRTVTIMASSLCGAAIVMFAIAVLVAKRRRRETSQIKQVTISVDEEEDDTLGGATITSYRDDDDDMTTTGPPPPSEDDLRAQAFEAERQYALEKGLGTILEDATYHSGTTELIPADASHLGCCSSSMDVQPCQSPNCKQCREDGVVFIPRDWQPDMTAGENEEDEESQSSVNAII